MLHTVNKSAFTHSLLRSCLLTVQRGDAIVLLNEGVYGGTQSSPCAEDIQRLAADGCLFYGLKADAENRGLGAHLLPCIALIDYADFVDLAASHQHTQSWY